MHLLTSVKIMGVEVPKDEILETQRGTVPVENEILRFYTKEEINGIGSIQQTENPSSSSNNVRIFLLSGSEVKFKQSEDHYNIEHDGKTFVLSKNSVGSRTMHYKKAVNSAL